ncbi:MAG: type II toxin-antitoxin system VapC family toxin [Acidobacteria bacterium]|nr:type II toxin-antitoxin system VapC family toxin [Acidobacteriota bacterium]
MDSGGPEGVQRLAERAARDRRAGLGGALSGRLVLDTSAYSHFRAGHDSVLELVADAEVVVMPVPVLGELEAGFEQGRRTRDNQQVLADFLEEPFVTVVDLTRETVRHYARIVSALRRAGTPIPINDVWIAAATRECGGHLLTFDRHFQYVADLDATILDG